MTQVFLQDCFKMVRKPWLKKQHKNYQYIFVLFHYFGATSIVKCICVFYKSTLCTENYQSKQ